MRVWTQRLMDWRRKAWSSLAGDFKGTRHTQNRVEKLALKAFSMAPEANWPS